MFEGLTKWFFDTSEEGTSIGMLLNGAHVTVVSNERDCVLVVDASGSMTLDDWYPTRLDGAKEASKEFCTRLASEEPDSRIAIVAYGCGAETRCPLIPARNQRRIEKGIDKIVCLGSTNMKAGLRAALNLLVRSQRDCQIVFLSDGQNTGCRPLRVAERIKLRATVDCVGIGGSPSDVDEELMKKLASEHPDGSKRYRWIGDRERLVKHFHNLAGRISRS